MGAHFIDTLFIPYVVFFLSDKQKPTIVFCPGTVYQAITASEARITWKEPEFTDNVKVDRVTSTKKSGDTFPLGSTIVKYEAFDEKGNVESCSFTVELTRKSMAQKVLCLLLTIFSAVRSKYR